MDSNNGSGGALRGLGTSQPRDTLKRSSISTACKKCMQYYQDLCDILQDVTTKDASQYGYDHEASLATMQDARMRFKAWAVNIAALHRENLPSSLDFRLKDASEIRQRILKVLKNLEESLVSATYIATGAEPNETWESGAISDSEENQGSVPPEEVTMTSDLDELFKAIKTSNRSLMKISMVIRSSPGRDDYLKAASRYRFDPRYDIGHVKEKYPLAKENSDWLIERLGKAITRRRQYLKYREEHHSKLARDCTEVPNTVEEVMPDGDTPVEVRPENTIVSTKYTKATTFIENVVIAHSQVVPQDGSEMGGSFGSQTSYEATITGETAEVRISVPPHPQMAFEGVPFEFGEPFQCPYCYTEQTVKNRAAWKRHVFRDLKPYVCTFRRCDLRMFKSRNEWFAHEIRAHRREWVCAHCQVNPFTTSSAFESHLLSTHHINLDGTQLEALVLQSEEPVDKIPASACHLCDDWKIDLLDSKHDSKRLFLNDGKVVKPYGTLKQFRRHLGRHMEQLALFALPMNEGEEMEDDSANNDKDEDSLDSDADSNSEEAKKVSNGAQSLSRPITPNLDADKPEDLPFFQKFHQEPYTLNCICDYEEDDGSTIQCTTCESWQHIKCYMSGWDDLNPLKISEYSCMSCQLSVVEVYKDEQSFIESHLGLGLSHTDWEREWTAAGYEWTNGIRNQVVRMELEYFREEIQQLKYEFERDLRRQGRKQYLESILERLKGKEWMEGVPHERVERFRHRRLLGPDAKIRTLQNYVRHWDNEKHASNGPLEEDAPTKNQPKMTVVLDTLDITDLDVDPEFLDSLPEDFRKEVIMLAIAQKRGQAAAANTDLSETNQELFNNLSKAKQDEILHRMYDSVRQPDDRSKELTSSFAPSGNMRVDEAITDAKKSGITGTSDYFHLFVDGLANEVDDEVLLRAFSSYGPISGARVFRDVKTGVSKGYGFVAFRIRRDADDALESMNGDFIGSRSIRCHIAYPTSTADLERIAIGDSETPDEVLACLKLAQHVRVGVQNYERLREKHMEQLMHTPKRLETLDKIIAETKEEIQGVMMLLKDCFQQIEHCGISRMVWQPDLCNAFSSKAAILQGYLNDEDPAFTWLRYLDARQSLEEMAKMTIFRGTSGTNEPGEEDRPDNPATVPIIEAPEQPILGLEELPQGDVAADVIRVNIDGKTYSLEFIPGCIKNGMLLVRNIKNQVATRLLPSEAEDAKSLVLLYNGVDLVDDEPCRSYGIQSTSEVTCIVGAGGQSVFSGHSSRPVEIPASRRYASMEPDIEGTRRTRMEYEATLPSDRIDIRYKGKGYRLRFALGSIDDGGLLVSDVRTEAAMTVGIPSDQAWNLTFTYMDHLNPFDDSTPWKDLKLKRDVELHFFLIQNDEVIRSHSSTDADSGIMDKPDATQIDSSSGAEQKREISFAKTRDGKLQKRLSAESVLNQPHSQTLTTEEYTQLLTESDAVLQRQELSTSAQHTSQRPTLQEILDNKTVDRSDFNDFSAFLRRTNKVQELSFIQDVKYYNVIHKALASCPFDMLVVRTEHALNLWRKLMRSYIQTNGVSEVFLPADLQQSLLAVPSDGYPPDPELLEPAMKIVYDRMNESALPAFFDSLELAGSAPVG